MRRRKSSRRRVSRTRFIRATRAASLPIRGTWKAARSPAINCSSSMARCAMAIPSRACIASRWCLPTSIAAGSTPPWALAWPGAGGVRVGEPRLYGFRVVFADIHRGGIDAALGSGLAVRGGGAQTIHYQSRYGDDGVRRCVYLPPVVPSKDAIRKQFSRREFVVRGVCDTDLCPQFASGECRFAGTLRFYIPGMPGAGLYCLETGSTQAASEIYLRLSSLLDECGYLPNFIPDGRPVFWLTKALKNRVYYDEEGNQKKGEQWVPVLETEIDLTKVKMLREHKRMLLAAPSAQPAASGLPAAWVMSDPQEAGAGHCAAEPACQVDNDGVVLEGAPERVTASDASDAWLVATAAADAGATTGAATKASATGASHGVAVDLLAKARDMGIEHKVTEWAALRYGAQWDKEPAGTALERVRAILA